LFYILRVRVNTVALNLLKDRELPSFVVFPGVILLFSLQFMNSPDMAEIFFFLFMPHDDEDYEEVWQVFSELRAECLEGIKKFIKKSVVRVRALFVLFV
jgi:hypothetical protein